MIILKYIFLGLIQGIAEFLPISSSGHLLFFDTLLGVTNGNNLALSIVVHFATLLSIFVVFRERFIKLFKALKKPVCHEEKRFILYILLSTIPIGLVGIFFKDNIEKIFSGNMIFLGSMFILTAIILLTTIFSKKNAREITVTIAILVGIAQAFAILPGISRSGITIAFALLLGIQRDKAVIFSFFMSVLPILGATLIEMKDFVFDQNLQEAVEIIPLTLAFIVAFAAGIISCKLIIKIVKNQKIHYFSIYCLLLGIFILIYF
jgi:undecaprenyl-diphosphatase